MSVSYNPANIRAQIVSVLNTVAGSGQPLAFVYDFPNPNPAGYPCAIMDMDTDDGQYLDNITNLHEITFKIWIIQELTVISGGQDAAIANLDAACAAVVVVLEKISNLSLGGTVVWSAPTSGQRRQTQTENGPVFYKEIILKCNVTSSLQ